MRKAILLLLAALLPLHAAPEGMPEKPEISAACAVVMTEDGQILMEKNAHERSLIASTTKLMTALVIWEHCSPEETVRIPAESCGIEGSSLYLSPGEEYTVKELLTGLLLASGNDAAEALALHAAGSEAVFADWMNEKAAALGMTDSHFVNPHGLNAEGHYSSAADLALLMRACMASPELAEILGKREAAFHGQNYVNHNKLLWRCDGCLGGKTGYTQAAGRCLVSCCEREGTRLICVTLNAPDDWNDQMALYDWGFARVVTGNVTANLRYDLPLGGGGRIELAADPLVLCLPRDAVLKVRAELPPFVLPPVREGEVAGRVTVLLDGEILGEAALRFCPAETAQRKLGEINEGETAKDYRGLRLDGPPQGGGGH